MKQLQCPYCDTTKPNAAGLSMHVKFIHPEHWKGNLKESAPGLNLGNGTTKKKFKGGVPKGYKKPKIYNKCPFCSYKSDHPPGLAKHIQFTHPLKWKGDLGSSLGREPSRPWRKKDTLQSRKDNAAWRARNIAKGLTASGKKRKRARSATNRKRFQSLFDTPKKRIKPIVYPLPGDWKQDVEAEAEQPPNKAEQSLIDRVIDRVAERIAEKLLQ